MSWPVLLTRVEGQLKSWTLCDGLGCTINEGDPHVAVSWMYTNNPARGRGWLLCTLPTLPQSQNLCAWALFMLFPVLPFHAPIQTGGEPRPSRRLPTFPAARRP